MFEFCSFYARKSAQCMFLVFLLWGFMQNSQFLLSSLFCHFFLLSLSCPEQCSSDWKTKAQSMLLGEIGSSLAPCFTWSHRAGSLQHSWRSSQQLSPLASCLGVVQGVRCLRSTVRIPGLILLVPFSDAFLVLEKDASLLCNVECEPVQPSQYGWI